MVASTPAAVGHVTAADPKWLKLGLAAALGLVAGATLFATEAQGRDEARRPARAARLTAQALACQARRPRERHHPVGPGDPEHVPMRMPRLAEVRDRREGAVEAVAFGVAAARRQHRQAGVERRADAGGGILERDRLRRRDAEAVDRQIEDVGGRLLAGRLVA